MATHVVVRIADVDDEFEIPGDDLLVGDDGELTIFRYDTPGDVDTARVWAVFSSHTYAYLVEDDESELERALKVAKRNGFVIDDVADEDDDEDEEDEGDDDEDEEDDEDDEDEELDEVEIVAPPASDNGHAPLGEPASVLVPVLVGEPEAEERPFPLS